MKDLNIPAKIQFGETVLILLGVLTIAVAARFSITVPGSQVPQSAQSFILLLIAFLPGRRGLIVVLVYLLVGLLGLPVFADGASGLEYFLASSLGYFIGFVLAVGLLDIYKSKTRQANLLQLISVMLLAHTLILFAGWFRLSFMLNTTAAFYAGVQPFLLGALYKSIAAAVIVYALRKHIWKSAVAN